MEIRDGGIVLEYKDETGGSYRHWQVVESVREVQSEEEADKPETVAARRRKKKWLERKDNE